MSASSSATACDSASGSTTADVSSETIRIDALMRGDTDTFALSKMQRDPSLGSRREPGPPHFSLACRPDSGFGSSHPCCRYREETMDVAALTPATLAIVIVPPLSGRLFGGQDTPHGCRVAIVNDVAAGDVFGNDAVGQSIDDPTGQPVEIVGVVATREGDDARDPIRPTICYYADQTGIPTAPAAPGCAREHNCAGALRLVRTAGA
jgi:hypothetical protein